MQRFLWSALISWELGQWVKAVSSRLPGVERFVQSRKSTTHCRSSRVTEIAAEPKAVLEQIGLLLLWQNCMQSTMGKRERWYFMPEREGKGQERPGRPSCYLERDFKLEVSSWLIPSVFQGKGFLRVSAHSVSLKRNNIPQLLIFSRYFSYKWMILQNANSLLSGSTVSVSEWKPNYIGFL